MKIISVLGIKGGCGKTSAAVPLAYEASKRGTTVLLDLDPSLSATQWLEQSGTGATGLRHVAVSAEDAPGVVKALRGTGEVKYLVLDTPPLTKSVMDLSMRTADVLLMPTHIGSGDVAQAAQTLELLAAVERAQRPQARGLLNHSVSMPAVARSTRSTLEAVGLKVLNTEIPFLRLYIAAKGTLPADGWPHFGEVWTELEGEGLV